MMSFERSLVNTESQLISYKMVEIPVTNSFYVKIIIICQVQPILRYAYDKVHGTREVVAQNEIAQKNSRV